MPDEKKQPETRSTIPDIEASLTSADLDEADQSHRQARADAGPDDWAEAVAKFMRNHVKPRKPTGD